MPIFTNRRPCSLTGGDTSCGHKHKTLPSALRCRDAEAKTWGTSTTHVYEGDGVWRPLTRREISEGLLLNGPGWCILRHGGRSSDTWRVQAGPFAQEPTSLWRKARGAVRQGGLRMVDPEGKVVKEYQAPRLRSRW